MNKFKKLAYKSHYRGTKEGDYILSSFAKYELKNCTPPEIAMYEEMLDYSDVEIQEWVLSPHKAPAAIRGIITKISVYHKLGQKIAV